MPKYGTFTLLRIIASIYDPCGIVSPLLLPAKLFLQKLWKHDYKWDTPLSQDLESEWKIIVTKLNEIKNVNIPRYAGLPRATKPTEYELHCFCDASKQAYAAVAYLRSDNGRIVKTTFLMSKSRIIPLEKEKKNKGSNETIRKQKPLTIPQLEVLGFVIGNRLISYLKNILELPIAKQYLWTDSLIVLSWMKSNKLLTPWVTNRVNEIKKNAEVEMCYVNTKQNPADLATRLEFGSQNQKRLWLTGPTFLTKNSSKWPACNQEQATFSAVAEGLEQQPPDVEMVNEPLADEQCPMTQSPSRVSETDITKSPLTSDIIELKGIQYEHFPEEIKGKETHLIRNLGLFMDIDGILRCGGRIMHADCSYEMKPPILLPKNCDFTLKIIRDIHVKNYHVGVSHTLSLVRQKYWIPQGRSQVQKVLKRCPQCIKHGGGPYKLPLTPALPPEQVRYEAPFVYTGLDYFGPIFVKTRSGKEKRWICLFTCLVVRSIHLEIVLDMTAKECLMALRRFIAARGIPSLILSDNALQFKLTSEVITKPYCVENKIKWRFTPELAPWHGVVYERLVAVVKECLKRSLGKHLLNDTQLSTIIKEVEAVVNTRPLTSVSSDPEHILKPSDFLSLGKCLTMESSPYQSLPKGSTTKQDLIAGWRRGLNFLEEFKSMFINRYLTSLRERYRHTPKQPRVKVDKGPSIGDLVQIKGETKNRQSWKVGKITELLKGADGECRVAKVRVGDSQYTRSIGHLYPLEADIEGESDVFIRTMTDEHEVPTQLEAIPMLSQAALPKDPNKSLEENNEVIADIEPSSPPQENEVLEKEGETIADEITPELPVVDEEVETDDMQGVDNDPPADRERRVAAINARQRIREWTRHLVALL